MPNPSNAQPTGKTVAVIGGGPGGLSAAYYLSLMGHKVTVFEQRSKLGGMLRYGIPSYRFPREILDKEIESILSTGIEVKTGITVGSDVSFDELKNKYDALYIAIGAHTDKKTGIEGEDSRGRDERRASMLRAIGDDSLPDFTGKEIVVDRRRQRGHGRDRRSSVRLGAEEGHPASTAAVRPT